MRRESQQTPEEAWEAMRTPETKTNIIKGVINLAMSMFRSPEEAGEVFENLDDESAKGIGYLFGGIADGETVRMTGRALRGKREKD